MPSGLRACAAVDKFKKMNYAVSLKICGKYFFLLWRDGGNTLDEYVLLPGTSRFLLGRTAEELLAEAARLGLHVVDQEPAAVDMDRVFGVLAALRPERLSSPKTCQLLLNGWNTLEDMARPIGVRLNAPGTGEREILDVIYDKLFYGSNLPAITPDGQSYSPLFSSSERKMMRAYLRCMWREILERSKITGCTHSARKST